MTDEQRVKIGNAIDEFMKDLALNVAPKEKAYQLERVAVEMSHEVGEAELKDEYPEHIRAWSETLYERSQNVSFDTQKSNYRIMAKRLNSQIMSILEDTDS